VKAGDLVRFHKCALAGTTGIVVGRSEPSEPFADRPHLHVFYVAVSKWNGQVQTFTGSQLEVISESR